MNSQLRIASMMFQGDTCTKNSIDLRHIIAIATNKSDEEIIAKYNDGDSESLDLTDDQLKAVEVDLSKKHSAEKVERVSKIIRGLRDPRTKELAEVSDNSHAHFDEKLRASNYHT